jgi:very-short-patch-repair endonuclease
MKSFSLLDKVMSPGQRRRMRFVGIKKTLKPEVKTTSLERRYYMMLTELGVDFIPQFPLGGRFYDAYLPDHNILFEFDGAFWHPKTSNDAKYGFQKKAMRVDELKTRMAREKGYKIIRIREDEPITTEQMRKLIWD